ncbi:hypothetical protein HDU96_002530 [Phlyctochytrium bullatum]|nr:hypothetical protein HDU96_002530 [Phlyctochytrium bullatum]
MEEIFQHLVERRVVYNFIRMNGSTDLMIEEFNKILGGFNGGKPVRVTELASRDYSVFLELMVRSE